MTEDWPTTEDIRDCIKALERYAGEASRPRIICSPETSLKLAALVDERGVNIWQPETGLLLGLPVIVDAECEDVRLFIRWD